MPSGRIILAASAFTLFWPIMAGTGEVVTGPIAATVLQVVDGDTLKVDAAIWPGQRVATQVRVLGVDTPELRGRCPEEIDRARQAKAFVQSWVAAGGVRLENVQFGKYAGRVLAKVVLTDGESLEDALIAHNLARPYQGGKRSSWCD